MSSHPQRIIRLYHGSVSQKTRDVLEWIACPLEEDNNKFFFDSSLEELYQSLSKVGAMFYVQPNSDIIFVTDKKTWGAY